jgi:hypothetical protein
MAFFVVENGAVYACGRGEHGKLGLWLNSREHQRVGGREREVLLTVTKWLKVGKHDGRRGGRGRDWGGGQEKRRTVSFDELYELTISKRRFEGKVAASETTERSIRYGQTSAAA